MPANQFMWGLFPITHPPPPLLPLSGFLINEHQREPLAYLRAEKQFSNRNESLFLNVLLCDLKMPGMDGFHLLEWLQNHHECKVIPTIVFSPSHDERDIDRAYVLGADAYLVKPHDLRELMRCQVPRPPPKEICD